MNPTAIYSKTGKGVQEASGKTSLLKRPDRAVLSAIDGRATLNDVAQKVGKPFDAEFEKLIGQLDKDGFVREVSAGVAAKPAPGAAKAPPPKAAPPKAAPSSDSGGDLDFSAFSAPAKPAAPASPPPRPAAPPPRPAAPPPPPPRPAAPPPPAAKPAAPQQSALDKAREEAEARAAAERERIKAESEAKVRAELEAKARAEAEAKFKAEAESKAKSDAAARIQADADAKIKMARDAAVRTAAEAKAKADAEAKRGREEAEKARKEADELKQRLEEERKAREDADRRAKEEGERARKELEAERQKLEEDRKKREEDERKAEDERRRKREDEERKAEEERVARRKREEDEEKERKRKREEEEKKVEEERAARRKREEDEEKERQRKKEEERKRHDDEERKVAEERAARRKREAEDEERRAEEERATRKKKREEDEARLRAEEEESRRVAEEERQRREAEEEAERQRLAAEEADRRKSEAQKSIAESTAPSAPAASKPGAAPAAGGLDSLMADLDSFGKKDEEEAKARAEAERKAKEQARRAEEDARREAEEKKVAEERARRQRESEEEERRAEEERVARRKKREEEERREEDERKEREKKRRDEEEAAEAEAKKAKGKKGKAAKEDIPVSDDDIDMDDVKRDQKALAGRKKEKAWVAPPPVSGPSVRRQPRNLGKPIALALVLLLGLAVGGIHVMPLGTAEYERAASEAVGRPVKIASGNIWLFSGLQLRLSGVTIGDIKVAKVTAYPTFDALTGERKTFTRIDLDGVSLPQEALAEALFAKVRADKFAVSRVVARNLDLTGPLPLPKGLEADILLDNEGAATSVTVRGPDTLVAKLTPKGSAVEFDVNAGGFVIPFAPEITLGTFGMKGSATRQGMTVTEWDGTYLNGKLSGTANIRWGATWSADGVVTARGVNAGVFAPALVSEGRGEGTAKYSLSSAEPAKLGQSGRYDATFKVESGALGGVDLSRALRTGGRETAGRTPFTEMTGQGAFDRGAVAVRNVQITQGSMNAAASADISREGALSGRVVADVRAGSQTLRATLTLGGTVRDPQFRN